MEEKLRAALVQAGVPGGGEPTTMRPQDHFLATMQYDDKEPIKGFVAHIQQEIQKRIATNRRIECWGVKVTSEPYTTLNSKLHFLTYMLRIVDGVAAIEATSVDDPNWKTVTTYTDLHRDLDELSDDLDDFSGDLDE